MVSASVRRLRALAPPFRPYRGWIAGALALGLGAAALGAVEPLFFKYLLDLLVRTAGHGGDAAVRAQAWRGGVEALAVLGAVFLLQRLLETGQMLAVNRVRFDSSFDLSSAVLERLYDQPLSFHQNSGPGYVLTRMDRGVAAIGQVVNDGLQSLVPNSANLLLMAFLLYRLSPRLAWIGLAPMPLYLWATLHGAARLAGHEEVVQEGWSQLYRRVNEVLGGIKTVKSMSGEAAEIEQYRQRAKTIFARLWRVVFVEAGYGELKGGLAMAGRLGVAGYGFALVANNTISPGTWVAATSYAALLYGPLAGLAGLYSSILRQLVAAGVVLDFLEKPVVAPDASPLAPFRLPRLRGEIRFEQVSYAYPRPAAAPARAPRYAIDDVSFHIEAGETIAIIGPSGGGKTTLTDLLLRFYDPSDGRILLDGMDLRSLPPAALRRQMAVVLQEPLLLQGTIAENVAYGCGPVSPARLQAALEAAQAAAFIARLPEGVETRLGERGARLSGGEKQRLAIARALLRDPRILILDEATAHLDAASETALNQALRELVRNRTAIVISHRLASLLAPDRIFVLGGGRLLESGTPAALEHSGGFYARWAASARPRRAVLGTVAGQC